jgi:hypothetical protein
MFKINRNKKTSAVVAGGVLAVATAGGAYAYWTTQGEGSGSATTSAGAASLVVSETSNVTGMFPGDTAQALTGTVKNTAANAAYVTKVTASIANVVLPLGATGCDKSDYTLANPEMTVAQDLASGETFAFKGASIKFNNKTTNQDGCKGATVLLTYTAS